ncbi:VanZ family protein [Virgibacillus sp. MSJ-26]|uniref:VanZ family protein n=1 Tax=Virgibacillus sp. MSJ-26 TaxID=2841522 RepID=UPI001C11495E|nr:VanZ family protein [Virgibacillus sp. MSJ-26]MBU5467322.1 VanZ family protein [Virgibacillus sp. MSJ-26]
MSKTTNHVKFASWIAVILWMALIFYLSHQPSSVSSGLSSGLLMSILNRVEGIIPFEGLDMGTLHHLFRKSAHFIAYLILGMLCFNALKKSYPHAVKSATLAFLICVLYAISDETHQLFIPGRSGEVRDVFIDSLGSITGISIYYMIAQLKKIVSSTSNEEA